jgi:hypothetical protein
VLHPTDVSTSPASATSSAPSSFAQAHLQELTQHDCRKIRSLLRSIEVGSGQHVSVPVFGHYPSIFMQCRSRCYLY